MSWLKRLAVVVISAIILSFVLPIPISTGIAVFLALVLFQLIGERFQTGIATAREWAGVGVAAISAFGVYIILRLIFWRVVGIAPIVSRETWDASGGLVGVFWGRNPMPVFLLWEVLFAAVVASFCLDYAKEKLGHHITTGPRQKLVTLIMVGALALTTVKLALPLSYQTGRVRVSDAGIAEILKGWFKEKGGKDDHSTTGETHTHPSSAATPVPEIKISCKINGSAALQDLYSKGIRQVAVVIEDKECWTPILRRPRVPESDSFSKDFSSDPEETLEEVFHFRDGTSEQVTNAVAGYYNPEKLVIGRAFMVPAGTKEGGVKTLISL